MSTGGLRVGMKSIRLRAVRGVKVPPWLLNQILQV
jgi:hypothetical protein